MIGKITHLRPTNTEVPGPVNGKVEVGVESWCAHQPSPLARLRLRAIHPLRIASTRGCLSQGNAGILGDPSAASCRRSSASVRLATSREDIWQERGGAKQLKHTGSLPLRQCRVSWPDRLKFEGPSQVARSQASTTAT